MKTTMTESLDTWGVTIAYAHPTPHAPGLAWGCVGLDPEVFDPVDETALAEALAVCAGCDAITTCLALGVARREWGVWGGVLLENGKPIDTVKQRGRPKKATAA